MENNVIGTLGGKSNYHCGQVNAFACLNHFVCKCLPLNVPQHYKIEQHPNGKCHQISLVYYTVLKYAPYSYCIFLPTVKATKSKKKKR